MIATGLVAIGLIILLVVVFAMMSLLRDLRCVMRGAGNNKADDNPGFMEAWNRLKIYHGGTDELGKLRDYQSKHRAALGLPSDQ